ncbi:serine/threonine-protein kinase [Aliikangiella coralliicola]|uniref:Serine/threonine protein kinase n=1 Tax=Aliikangiella coralliicola TaxID=2592383 RepID=A0A545UCG5_9GAMM|nr:serine/threonine-protein kinase [Aliikangiella coralliicola]TQV87113.1 serine/threonine protein kinase [Aliikangiella coralliicola]
MKNDKLSEYAFESFHNALELAPKDRVEYISAALLNNETIKKQLIDMLNKHERADEFLKVPPELDAENITLTGVGDKKIGNKYRVLKVIGSGGMGTVYLAERVDNIYARPVALKLIRGVDHNPEQINRFERERKILSKLDHPNIAKLLDGGTSKEGFPYYVMEFIKGRYITDYCQSLRLTIRQRIELFLSVCSGVVLAHRNLIIHRDLKPSNILVNSNGQPKLLDFGIAKDLAEKDLTVTALPLTPHYASPEQVRQEQLTTETDIYSLGVILYELLTGVSPYDSVRSLELLQQISDSTPKLMSQMVGQSNKKLSRLLTGDLDTIVMKAIQKEPERRYASVQEFADDLRRYLNSEPVIARKDSVWYRVSRLYKRNKILTSVIIVSLVTLISVGAFLQFKIINESHLVAIERDKFKHTQEYLLGILQISRNRMPKEYRGMARGLLEHAIKNATEGLNSEPGVKSEIMNTLGVAYMHLGDYKLSAEMLRPALALRQQNFPQNSLEVAESKYELARLSVGLGNYQQANELYMSALEIYQSSFEQEYSLIANIYSLLGWLRWSQGQYEQAINFQQKSLDIRLKLPGLQYHYSVAENYLGLGNAYAGKKNFERALDYHQKALDIFNGNVDDLDISSGWYFLSMANTYVQKKEPLKAIEYFEKNLDVFVPNFGEDNVILHESYAGMGEAYLQYGKNNLALYYGKKARDICLKNLGESHPGLVSPYLTLAAVHASQGESWLALGYFTQAHTIARKSFGTEHFRTREIANHINRLKIQIPVIEETHTELSPLTKKTH